MSDTSPSRRSFALQIALQLVGSGLALGFTSLLSHTLSPSDFGMWVEVRALIDLWSIILCIALPQYVLFRAKEGIESIMPQIIGQLALLATVVLLGIAAGVLETREGLAILFLSTANVIRPSVLVARPKLFGAFNIASWLFAGTIFYLSTHSSDMAVVSYGAGFLIASVICGWLSGALRTIRIRFDWLRERGFWTYNAAAFIANTSHSFASWYVIRHTAAAEHPNETAYLGIALTMGLSLALMPANLSAPLALHRWAIAGLNVRARHVVGVALLPSLIGLLTIVFLGAVIDLVFGSAYRGASYATSILLGLSGVFYLERFQTAAFQAGGDSPRLIAGALARTLALILLLELGSGTAADSALSLVIAYAIGILAAHFTPFAAGRKPPFATPGRFSDS